MQYILECHCCTRPEQLTLDLFLKSSLQKLSRCCIVGNTFLAGFRQICFFANHLIFQSSFPKQGGSSLHSLILNFFQFCRNVPGNLTNSFSRAWYSMTLVGYEANEKYMFCPIFNIAVQGWFFQFWIRGKIIVGQWFHLILRIRANTPRSSWDCQTMWLVHFNMKIYWYPQIQFCT